MTRILRTMMIFGIVGAVLNVAVAWGCSFFDVRLGQSKQNLFISAVGGGGSGTKGAYGLPLRSMYGETTTVTSFGTTRTTNEWCVFIKRRMIPLRPMPFGFAFNAVFWGGVAWTCIYGPGALQRHRRNRRGLCPSCGYDITNLDTCPECGR